MAGGGGILPAVLGIGAMIAAPELAPELLPEALGSGAAAAPGVVGGGLASLGSSVLPAAAAFGEGAGTVATDAALSAGAGASGLGATDAALTAGAGAGTTGVGANAMANMPLSTDAATNPLFTNTAGANAANGSLTSAASNIPDPVAKASFLQDPTGWIKANPMSAIKYGLMGAGGLGALSMLGQQNTLQAQQSPGVPKGLQFHFNEDPNAMYRPSVAPNYNGIAGLTGGPVAQRLTGYADGGTVEQMSRDNATSGNQMFPQAGLGGLTGANRFQNATNTPVSSNMFEPTDTPTDPYTGAMKMAAGGIAGRTPTNPTQNTQQNSTLNLPMVKQYLAAAATPTGLKQVQILAQQGDYNAQFAINHLQGNPVQDINAPSQVPVQAAAGGIMGYAKGGELGSYSDGGQMLKGPGDGMSDNIPATIGRKQPARLADGEFVVPADVVSHLGNGSTDAGAKHLYSMMDKVRQARTGRKAQGKQIKPEKYLPA